MSGEHDTSTPASSSLRVLAVAAACHPDRGSEPGLGWGWVQALAKRHQMSVIVGERDGNRDAIQCRLEADPQLARNLRVFYVPRPATTRLQQYFPPLYYRRYAQWHWQPYLLARQLTRETQFDLVHQINMIGYREPGYLWKLDLPFVWGPIDGATNMPLRFWEFLGLKGTAYYVAYNAVNTWQLHFNPRVRAAMRRANGVVVASEDMQRRLAECCGVQSTLIHDTGPVDVLAQQPISKQPNEPLRIVWSGIHVARKALPILLRALARLPKGLCQLDVLGAGPLTSDWKRLAGNLGVDAYCTWHGRLTRDEALDVMRNAHVFGLTSLRDATSTVLMEALSLGLPVICLDHCGFSDVVDGSCGIKISPERAHRVVGGFAQAIRDLAADVHKLNRLSQGAINRAATFSWGSHTDEMTRVYRAALQQWRSPGREIAIGPCLGHAETQGAL